MIEIAQEPERVRTTAVWGPFVIVLLSIALSVLVVYLIVVAVHDTIALPAGNAVTTGVPEEVNAIEAHVFGKETAAERDARSERRRLRSYGWVDRAKGRVHVPVEVAMERYLARRGARP